MKTIYLILPILIFSCSSPVEPPVMLSDTRFNGTFKYQYSWVANDGIDEINETTMLTFDGTERFRYYHYFKNYTKSGGWDMSPTEGYNFKFYMEVNPSHTMYRRIDKYYDTVGEWLPYSFNGNILTIDILDNVVVLTKN